jgi:hypothetical protein
MGSVLGLLDGRFGRGIGMRRRGVTVDRVDRSRIEKIEKRIRMIGLMADSA